MHLPLPKCASTHASKPSGMLLPILIFGVRSLIRKHTVQALSVTLAGVLAPTFLRESAIHRST